jgi:hypothetical protein
VGVQDAFGYVLFGVVGVGALLAFGTLFLRKSTYEQIGAGGFFKEDPAERAAVATNDPFRDEEIRQMLTARNARHTAAGTGEIVDVEDELARLTAPAIDAALIEEIREFVVKRNERRMAKGQEPLDVEAEVARRVAELS